MPKSVKVAVIQMNACPAPVKDRLAKAETFVIQCAQAGAQLVILPEVFNTGYEYNEQNYLQAESFDGLTATWMRDMAARHHIHLAGSFLRKEQDIIFNTLLLVAPDRRQWHYDKSYPWIWERAYFQNGKSITVADTELGKIGFLICWDVAHIGLWKQYAGKIDFMVISSCPPKAFDSAFVFPDGQRILSKDTGGLVQYLKHSSDETFGEYLRKQASFLGIPVVQATGTGVFSTSFPNSKLSLPMLSMFYPPLWKHKSQFEHVHVETEYFNETYITDQAGIILQFVPPNTEGVAISNVILPDAPPQPKGKQPSFGIPAFGYLFDTLANKLLSSEYRKKTKKYLSKQI